MAEIEAVKKKIEHKIVISGGAIPLCLIDPNVPRIIFSMLPNVKLIVLLRNTIDGALIISIVSY